MFILVRKEELPNLTSNIRSSRPEVFLVKGVLKICNKFTGEHPCRSVISIKLLCNFTEIALRHGCSPVNLLHIFRTSFPKNTSVWLFLHISYKKTFSLSIICIMCGTRDEKIFKKEELIEILKNFGLINNAEQC